METTIYSASDLANRRREFLDEARRGAADLRDTDGTGLVMVPASLLAVLTELRNWLARDLNLERVLGHAYHERQPLEFGDLAWLSHFDDDDQQEFHQELHEALVLSLASDSIQPVNQCVADWKRTAQALADPMRRDILKGEVKEGEFEEVGRPV